MSQHVPTSSPEALGDEVNVFGVTRVVQHFLEMLRNSKGRIINIGSVPWPSLPDGVRIVEESHVFLMETTPKVLLQNGKTPPN